MLTAFMQNPEVDQYLHSFPRAQWQRCLELTIALGVQTAKKRFPYGVTLEALARAVEKGAESCMDSEAMLEKLRKIKVEPQDPPEPSPETRPNRKTDTPDKRVVRIDPKTGILKQPCNSVISKVRGGEGSRKSSDSRSRHTRTEDEAREESARLEPRVAAKQAPSRKTDFLPTQNPPKNEDIDDVDAKETRIKPYIPKPLSAPQRRGKDASPRGETGVTGKISPPVDFSAKPTPKTLQSPQNFAQSSGPLIEPKTNLAYVGKLSPPAGAGKKGKPVAEAPRDKADLESSILKITDEFLSDPFIALLFNQTSPKWSKDRR